MIKRIESTNGLIYEGKTYAIGKGVVEMIPEHIYVFDVDKQKWFELKTPIEKIVLPLERIERITETKKEKEEKTETEEKEEKTETEEKEEKTETEEKRE